MGFCWFAKLMILGTVLVFAEELFMNHVGERGSIKSLACCGAETSYR